RAQDMYAWVNVTLDAGRAAGAPATGLFFDKLRGDGTIDHTLWTYNQGSMIGANVLLARQAARGDDAGAGEPYLARAEAIAAKALRHYAGTYVDQPAAFNAILFRNLLQLRAATADAALREQISGAMSAYAEAAWIAHRDRHDRFRFTRRGPTLLDQSAMVQVYALLAWDPADYGALA
ncbi:MAG: glycoside hydrolase family 76 protein, partial [Solirubrobacteraceae bacterium]